MKLMRCFTEHPASINETYTQHAKFAFGFGFRLIIGGIACCIHGLLPCLFKRTGSTTVIKMYQHLGENRRPTTLD